MKINKEVFRENFQLALSESGFKQSDIAKSAKISESMISDYIKGRFTPRPLSVIKLARALNVNYSWLAGEHLAQSNSRTNSSIINTNFINFTEIRKIAELLNDNTFKNQQYFDKYYDILKQIVPLNLYGLERLLYTIQDLNMIEQYRILDFDEVRDIDELIKQDK